MNYSELPPTRPYPLNMDDLLCFKCNMYVDNKFKKFQDGIYRDQFILQCNIENKNFVNNPQHTCENPLSVICYDIANGASTCKYGSFYDIQGNMVPNTYIKNNNMQ
jgi:hypothetical protein